MSSSHSRDTPPTAAFAYVTSGLDATFTSSSTEESAATALKYSWSFGRGTTSTQQSPLHTYAASGTYSVTLEVLDPGSGTSTATQSVTVTASSMPDAGVGGSDDAGTTGDGGVNGCGLPALLIVLRRRRRARS